MPWKAIPELSKEEKRQVDDAFAKKARFLIDENLDGVTTEAIEASGWNVKGVAELGLSGHSDEDIFAYAWRKDRILITNDRDFLDEGRFPEHRNPGIIILPDVPLESDAFLDALDLALSIIGPYRKAYRKSKIIVNKNRESSLILRNHATGKIEKQRFKYDEHGTCYKWYNAEE